MKNINIKLSDQFTLWYFYSYFHMKVFFQNDRYYVVHVYFEFFQLALQCYLHWTQVPINWCITTTHSSKLFIEKCHVFHNISLRHIYYKKVWGTFGFINKTCSHEKIIISVHLSWRFKHEGSYNYTLEQTEPKYFHLIV